MADENPAETPNQPERPTTYLVKEGDTFQSIAVVHDTTTTKLAQVNKMPTFTQPMVFPGQVLKLPEPEPEPVKEVEKVPDEDKDMVDFSNRFFRINVRHIVEDDNVAVPGTLMFTGKLFMFDAYGHDPVVAEKGAENFQVFVNFRYMVNAVVLYEKIAGDNIDESLIFSGQEDPEEPEDKVFYLRLRMGQPLGGRIARDDLVSTYGELRLLPAYWFALDRSRAGVVVRYFSEVADEKWRYGLVDIDEIESGHRLELVREGRDAIEPESAKILERCHMSYASLDVAVVAPMVGSSVLFGDEERIYLSKMMPPAMEMHTWFPVFSTLVDGTSLLNMVRKVSKENADGGPVLIVMSDSSSEHVFGAYLTHSPVMNEKNFQGSGETFLFTLRPQQKKYRWTGASSCFYKFTNEYFVVGADKGRFGLWVDSQLTTARSQSCCLFDNDPLVEHEEEFSVNILECWAFRME